MLEKLSAPQLIVAESLAQGETGLCRKVSASTDVMLSATVLAVVCQIRPPQLKKRLNSSQISTRQINQNALKTEVDRASATQRLRFADLNLEFMWYKCTKQILRSPSLSHQLTGPRRTPRMFRRYLAIAPRMPRSLQETFQCILITNNGTPCRETS